MESTEAHLNLDLDKLKNIAVLGVKRAAAFCAIALNATNDPAIQSIALPSVSMWRFFPEPPPEKLLLNSVAEFRIWVVGCALREVDAAFNEFLDHAWQMNELSKLHGKRIKSDLRIDSIEAKTNVGTKMALLLEQLGEEKPDTAKLWSLSNLRNCLTHARGVVTERHANEKGGLKIVWQGLEIGFQQGEEFVPIPNPIPKEGIMAPNPTEPASIAIRVVDKEQIFPTGSTISIDPGVLHEICHFYLTSTDRVVGKLLKAMSDRGLPVAQKATTLSETES